MTCTHLAIERELTEEGMGLEQLARDLTARREHPAGERKVKARTDLGHVGWRQVRRDSPRRELVAGVEHSSMHAVARLAHSCVGEAHDRECGQASSDVHLNGYGAGAEPFDCECACPCEHACLPSRLSGEAHQATPRLGRYSARASPWPLACL